MNLNPYSRRVWLVLRRVVSRYTPLTIGVAVSGFSALLSMTIIVWHLGLEANAPIGQLWTFWGLAATSVGFAVQQSDIARNRDRREGAFLRLPLRSWMTVGAGALTVTTVALVFTEEIFSTSGLTWPLALGFLVVGTSTSGIGYSTLAQLGRPTTYGIVVAVENLLRLGAALILIAFDAPAEAFAWIIPAGHIVSTAPAIVYRWSKTRPGPRSETTLTAPAPTDLPQGSLPSLAFIGFCAHALIFGAPIFLAVAGAPAVMVSATFLLLVPLRVPYQLVQFGMPFAAVAAHGVVAAGSIERLRRRLPLWTSLTLVMALGISAAAWAMFPRLGVWAGEPIGAAIPAETLLTVVMAAVIGMALTGYNVLSSAVDATRAASVIWAVFLGAAMVPTLIGFHQVPEHVSRWLLIAAIGVLFSLQRSIRSTMAHHDQR